MVIVPDRFRPHIKTDYPPNNHLIFEEWFYREMQGCIGRVEMIQDQQGKIMDYTGYLPIFWTSFYVNHDYGNNRAAKRDLQLFLRTLDRSKKYFTILQYDDGILNDVSHLDLKVFGSGNKGTDYPVPLLTMPHPYNFNGIQRDIFCNFMGSMTHQIRKDMLPVIKSAGYFVSTDHMPIDQYCQKLARSVFTLAPRGYGATSFRICEALQYGSIPVYISDEFIIPHNHNFNDYGVLIEASEVSRVHEILSQIPESEVRRKQEAGKKIYNEKFSFEGCKRLILDNL